MKLSEVSALWNLTINLVPRQPEKVQTYRYTVKKGLTPRSVCFSLPVLSLTLSSLCVTSRACMPSGREMGRGKGPNKTTEKTLSIFLYIPCTLDLLRLRECLMIYRELQAFSLSYDLAPRQPPSPLRKLDRRRDKSYDCKKAWSSINHSILSGPPPPRPSTQESCVLTR
jgi:hypothetical protein